MSPGFMAEIMLCGFRFLLKDMAGYFPSAMTHLASHSA